MALSEVLRRSHKRVRQSVCGPKHFFPNGSQTCHSCLCRVLSLHVNVNLRFQQLGTEAQVKCQLEHDFSWENFKGGSVPELLRREVQESIERRLCLRLSCFLGPLLEAAQRPKRALLLP